MWLGIKQRSILCFSIALLIAVCILSVQYIEPASPCFGPCITSNIDRTQLNVNETVTVSGQVCPAEENKTVRIAFAKPDYTYIDRFVLTDPITGNFSVTQKLDTAGYWNIFAIDGHISDRTFATVTDPANPNEPSPTSSVPSVYKPNYEVIEAGLGILAFGIVVGLFGIRNKTRKISSLRLLVQVVLLLLIFFGTFIDHWGYLSPNAEIAPHEINLSTNVLGVSMPDGLPAPFFGCFYPCGRTMTCALWQIQAYIYPFFNVGPGWGVSYDSTGLARLAIVFGVIILAAVLLGRFFCGWVCPFGLYVDLTSRLRKALKIKHRSFSDRFNTRFHQLSLRYLGAPNHCKCCFWFPSYHWNPTSKWHPKRRISLHFLFSAVLPSLPNEAPLHFSGRKHWVNEATVDYSEHDWTVLAAWAIHNINKSNNTRNSHCCSLLFPPFLVPNLSTRRFDCAF